MSVEQSQQGHPHMSALRENAIKASKPEYFPSNLKKVKPRRDSTDRNLGTGGLRGFSYDAYNYIYARMHGGSFSGIDIAVISMAALATGAVLYTYKK
jgi:hypothetical protein